MSVDTTLLTIRNRTEALRTITDVSAISSSLLSR